MLISDGDYMRLAMPSGNQEPR
ncbi:TPA: YmiA family putative membrane protein, partial [Escherichia coli]|nr:YmiA family putative membrane protein [Escherichia coli]